MTPSRTRERRTRRDQGQGQDIAPSTSRTRERRTRRDQGQGQDIAPSTDRTKRDRGPWYFEDQQWKQYHQDAKSKRAEVQEKQAQINALEKQSQGKYYLSPHGTLSLEDLRKELTTLQGELAVLETKRDNRGSVLTQSGVNTQAGEAGREAIKAENLLAQNINEEILSRIDLNTSQAGEAVTNLGRQQEAVFGRSIAKAGQAGYSASSGTGRAMREATQARYDADRAAIEDMRLGRENLLMKRGTSATDAAESLTGAIDTTTLDWKTGSTEAVDAVTGTLLTDVTRVTGSSGYAGNIYTMDNIPTGVAESKKTVGDTLSTWSFEKYMEGLDELTSGSVNKTTWEQMLTEKEAGFTNPYESYNQSDIAPLTPVAGVSSNILSVARRAPDVYTSPTFLANKRKGGLL